MRQRPTRITAGLRSKVRSLAQRAILSMKSIKKEDQEKQTSKPKQADPASQAQDDMLSELLPPQAYSVEGEIPMKEQSVTSQGPDEEGAPSTAVVRPKVSAQEQLAILKRSQSFIVGDRERNERKNAQRSVKELERRIVRKEVQKEVMDIQEQAKEAEKEAAERSEFTGFSSSPSSSLISAFQRKRSSNPAAVGAQAEGSVVRKETVIRMRTRKPTVRWSTKVENETVARNTVIIQQKLKVMKDVMVALKFEHLKAKKENEFRRKQRRSTYFKDPTSDF